MADRRWLLSLKTLATASVPPTGDLSKTWQEWAEKHGAILVVPEEGSATTVTRERDELAKRVEVLENKLAVIHDVFGALEGDGKETPWNYHGLVQFARIVRDLTATK